MELLVPIVLYSWIPLVPLIFRDMKRHRALILTYVFAWLFLPTDEISFPGIPDLDKGSATSLGVLISVMLFDFNRILRFRPHWLDLPLLLFVMSPIASSLTNGLGLYDGVSTTLAVFFTWGFPYLAGRLYFDRFDKVRELATGIFVGGLVYIPFCLIELRMSPQIYNWVYGFRQTVKHSLRYGGWRPVVFLKTGLELGMWMTAASLLGYALWRSKALRRIYGLPVLPLLLALFATTLACKSTGALLLLFCGIGIWSAVKLTRTPWPALVLLVIPVVYLPLRILGVTDGAELVAMAQDVFGAERAQSLEFRFENEVKLVDHALKRPWFGWGGWGRALIPDEWGEIKAIVDSFWIVALGNHGLLGMVSAFTAFLVAPSIACVRFANRRWGISDVGPLLSICVLLLLYMLDCLLNSMANAIYPLCLGAITGLLLQPLKNLIQDDSDGEFVERPRSRVGSTPTRGQLWPPRPEQAPQLESPDDAETVHQIR